MPTTTTIASTSTSFRLAQAALLLTSGLGWWLCPYSKVEESFNLQATHDLFYLGLGPALWRIRNKEDPATALPYDHLQYPGVVPRTFAGPLFLAGGCHGVRWLGRLASLGMCDLRDRAGAVQRCARGLLLLVTALQWFGLARAVEHRSPPAGTYLLLITACQFHLTYYMSRMLPNCFACVLTLRCFAHWVRAEGGRGNKDFEMMGAAIDLVLAATIFRCDLILLLFTVGLTWLATRQLTVGRAIRIGLGTVVVSLALTVPLDSLLWQRPVWPEGEVLYFNTILNKSSEWGVEAWHWYFTRAIPYAMLLTTFFVPLSFLRLPEVLSAWELRLRTKNTNIPIPAILDTAWLPFLVPAMGFVVLYSVLGHKETRFLFPVLPLFNVAAAVGASRIHRAAFAPQSKDKRVAAVSRLALACSVLSLLGTLYGTLRYIFISKHNYPGGDALELLIQHVATQASTLSLSNNSLKVKVYIDVAAAMTGVSLFGQRAAQQRTPGVIWTFDKGGYEPENAVTTTTDWSEFTHLVTENSELAAGRPFRLVTAGYENFDSMFVYERDGWIQTQLKAASEDESETIEA